MSYTVSGSGHRVDNEKAKAAFRAFVEALDEATDLDKRVEGWADPTLFSGSITGGHAEGTFGLTADEARQSAKGG
jgi:hypothetical protein